MPNTPPRLVLASTSRYRRELLERLGIPFVVEAPGVAEDALPGEAPARQAARLAQAKAAAVAARHPDALVIGSDQVAALGTEVLGKPGTPARAVEQLLRASGRQMEFLTAVTLIGPAAFRAAHTDVTRVTFRRLGRAEVERYVERDTPLDCAGSFRAESLGIALFEALESRDPTALIGLPLVWLASALKSAGLDPLGR